MKTSGMKGCLLDFELTESCLVEDEGAAVAMINELHKLGAQVHLDDFGTGYSSLSQLAVFRRTASSWIRAGSWD